MSFKPATKRAFAKYAQFEGRASRSEFWWFYLATVLLGFVALAPALLGFVGVVTESGAVAALGFGLSGLLMLALLGLIIPSISSQVRRLHDVGFSGWLVLLNFVSLGTVVLVLCALETSPNGDQYNIR